MLLGETDGAEDGLLVGTGVGPPSTYVGERVGLTEGAGVGLPGTYVGDKLGLSLGADEGAPVGPGVGLFAE